MADELNLDPTTPPTPVVFDLTPTKAIVSTLIGAILIVLTGTTTLITLLQARDFVALFNWLHNAEGASYLAAVSFVGTLGWRLWITVRKHAKATVAAEDARNSIARVQISRWDNLWLAIRGLFRK